MPTLDKVFPNAEAPATLDDVFDKPAAGPTLDSVFADVPAEPMPPGMEGRLRKAWDQVQGSQQLAAPMFDLARRKANAQEIAGMAPVPVVQIHPPAAEAPPAPPVMRAATPEEIAFQESARGKDEAAFLRYVQNLSDTNPEAAARFFDAAGNLIRRGTPTIADDLERGLRQLQLIGVGAARGAADVAGINTPTLDAEAGRIAMLLQNNPALVASFDEIGTSGSKLQDSIAYALRAVAEQAPMSAPSFVTGGAGGMIGRQIAARAVGKLVAEEAAKKMATAAAKGAAAGAMVGSTGLEFGSIAGDMADAGARGPKQSAVAFLSSLPAGALDAIGPYFGVRRIMGKSGREFSERIVDRVFGAGASKRPLGHVGGSVIEQIYGESLPEFLQTGIEQAAVISQDPAKQGEFLQHFLSEAANKERWEAATQALIASVPTGVASSVPGAWAARGQKPAEQFPSGATVTTDAEGKPTGLDVPGRPLVPVLDDANKVVAYKPAPPETEIQPKAAAGESAPAGTKANTPKPEAPVNTGNAPTPPAATLPHDQALEDEVTGILGGGINRQQPPAPEAAPDPLAAKPKPVTGSAGEYKWLDWLEEHAPGGIRPEQAGVMGDYRDTAQSIIDAAPKGIKSRVRKLLLPLVDPKKAAGAEPIDNVVTWAAGGLAGRQTTAEDVVTPDEFLDRLRREVIGAGKAQERAKAENDLYELQGAALEEFTKLALHRNHLRPVPVSSLAEGDSFELAGVPVTVTAINPDTLDVTVKGGRFGEQTLPGDGNFYPDAKIQRAGTAPAAKPGGPLAAAESAAPAVENPTAPAPSKPNIHEPTPAFADDSLAIRAAENTDAPDLAAKARRYLAEKFAPEAVGTWDEVRDQMPLDVKAELDAARAKDAKLSGKPSVPPAPAETDVAEEPPPAPPAAPPAPTPSAPRFVIGQKGKGKGRFVYKANPDGSPSGPPVAYKKTLAAAQELVKQLEAKAAEATKPASAEPPPAPATPATPAPAPVDQPAETNSGASVVSVTKPAKKKKPGLMGTEPPPGGWTEADRVPDKDREPYKAGQSAFTKGDPRTAPENYTAAAKDLWSKGYDAAKTAAAPPAEKPVANPPAEADITPETGSHEGTSQTQKPRRKTQRTGEAGGGDLFQPRSDGREGSGSGRNADAGSASTGTERADQRQDHKPDHVEPPAEKPAENPAEKPADSHEAHAPANVGNFVISDPDYLEHGGAKTKFNNNLEALRVLRRIQSEGRARATLEEQQALSRWVGWGQFPQVFDWRNSDWEKERSKLQDILTTDEEWNAAKASTINAHYTSPKIAVVMWKIAERLGFQRGRVLESGCGSGIFFGTAPVSVLDKTAFTGVELDPTTAAICKLLYPAANIQQKPFQSFAAPENFFDLNIGNYPFADIPILQDKNYRALRPYLHDYFLLKSLDKVKPGGLAVVITSTGTMDKVEDTIRAEVDKRAELVAAIRLPGGAFQKNAGTAVVTDILVFRKWLPDEVPHNEAWLKTAQVPDPAGGDPITVNEYFANHPEQMLGTLDRSGKMYRGNSKNVALTDDFEQRLEAALERLPRDIARPEWAKPDAPAEAETLAETKDKPKNGAYVVKDGKLYTYDAATDAITEEKASPGKVAIIKSALKVRDALNEVKRAELADVPEEEVKHARAMLKQAYDAFVAKHGRFADRANVNALKSDPDAPNLFALEVRDKKTGLMKPADIFTRRTVRAGAVSMKADTVEDALFVSLNTAGAVRPKQMADILKRDVESVERELVEKRLAFNDPKAGWQPAPIYLSGNVRRKLLEAREAALVDPKYSVNVAALEQVQPKKREYAEITVRCGAGWIPATDMADFAASLLDAEAQDFEISHGEQSGEWFISYSTRGDRLVAGKGAATSVWGTEHRNFIDLLQDVANDKATRVMDRVRNPDGSTSNVLNEEATAAAQAKQNQIKQAFQEWIWSDDARLDRLENLYNDTFNGWVDTQWDGRHLTLPGASQEIVLRPHQLAAIYRIIMRGYALLAHEVGSGKTYTMAAAAMEMKRLGLCNKPAITTLKSALPGVMKQIRELYPHAKVLTTEGRFGKHERRETVSRIATGDWDLIVLTHDNVNMLPMKPETQREFLEAELAELEAIIEEMREREAGSKKKSRALKDLEKAKQRLEERITAAMNGLQEKDSNTFFEETGIDFLMVDEAHKFKSLIVYTAGDRVKGIPNRLSQRATNMYMRGQWLMKMNKGRGLVFATGTPVSNTMVELFNMQRFLQMPELEAQGLRSFDSWKNTFGETVADVEKTVTGDFEVVARFKRFTNLQELKRLSADMMDTVFIEDLGNLVERPRKHEHLVSVPMSRHQRRFLTELKDRAEVVKAMQIDKKVDNFLKISTDGRKMAVDMRMVRASAPDEPDSKLNTMVGKVLEIAKKNPGKTQLIFSDLGTNELKNGFHAYEDIIKKLVAGGIPREKIINFSDLNEDQREKAATRIYDGDAIIGIGHSETMGTGINAQQHLLAVHHLDAPYVPAYVEQRDGRIWRQGNKNPDIHVYRYVTEGSFDAFMWNLLDLKWKFIRQFLRGGIDQRTLEEIDTESLSYEQIKAVASGDEDVIAFVQHTREVRELELAKMAHDTAQVRIRRNITWTEGDIQRNEAAAAELEKDIAQNEAEKKKDFSIEIEGERYTDRKKAGARLLPLIGAPLEGSDTVAVFRGFDLAPINETRQENRFAERKKVLGLRLRLKHSGEWYQLETEIGDSGETFINRISAVLGNLPNRLTRLREDIEATKKNLVKLKESKSDTFKDAAKLEEARNKLAEVEGRVRQRDKIELEKRQALLTAPTPPAGWMQLPGKQFKDKAYFDPAALWDEEAELVARDRAAFINAVFGGELWVTESERNAIEKETGVSLIKAKPADPAAPADGAKLQSGDRAAVQAAADKEFGKGNVKVVDQNNLPPDVKKQAAALGVAVPRAFYLGSDGGIYIVVEAVPAGVPLAKALRESYQHELIHGLRDVIGAEAYAKMLRDVSGSLPKAHRDWVVAHYRIGSLGKGGAVEEALAHLAQDVDMTSKGVARDVWRRVVAAVRGWWRKVVGKLELSENDVRQLLRRAAGGMPSVREQKAGASAGAKMQAGENKWSKIKPSPYNETAEDREREKEIIRFGVEHEAEVIARYLEDRAAKGPPVLDPDVMREYLPHWPDTPRNRAMLATVTHNTATHLIDRAYEKLIAAPPSGTKRVLMLSGGPAAGKSSAVRHLGSAVLPELTVDRTLADFDQAVNMIEPALASGRVVTIVFAARPYEATVRGAITRAVDSHRTVPPDVHAYAHYHAPRVFGRLMERYRADGRVTFKAVNTEDYKNPLPIPLDQLDFEPYRHVGVEGLENQWYEHYRSEIEARRGTPQQAIPGHVADSYGKKQVSGPADRGHAGQYSGGLPQGRGGREESDAVKFQAAGRFEDGGQPVPDDVAAALHAANVSAEETAAPVGAAIGAEDVAAGKFVSNKIVESIERAGTMPTPGERAAGDFRRREGETRVAAIKRGLKSIGNVIRKSATDTLQLAGGRLKDELLPAVNGYYDDHEALNGALSSRIFYAIQEVPFSQRKKVRDAIENYWLVREARKEASPVTDRLLAERGLADASPDALLEAMTPETRKVLKTIEDIFALTVKKSKALGVQVKDTNTGRWRASKMDPEGYVPRVMLDDVARVLAEPNRHPKQHADLMGELVDHLRATRFFKQGETKLGAPDSAEAFAEQLLANYEKPEFRNDFFGNLEMSRVGGLPPSWFEYRFDRIVPHYVAAWSKRIAQIRNFGQATDDQHPDLWKQLLQGPDAVREPNARNYVLTLERAIKEQQPRSRGDSVLRWLRAWATASKLGNPWTSIRNTGQIVNALAEFGTANTLPELVSLKKLAANIRTAREAGVLRSDMIAGFFDESEFSHAQQTMMNVALKAGGFTATEQWQRAVAIGAAYNWSRKMLAEIERNPQSSTSTLAKAKFAKYGVNWRRLAEDGLGGAEGKKLARAAARSTMFAYDLRQTPLWMDSQGARFLFQFQKFGIQQLRFIEQNIIAPAVTGYTIEGKRVRDFKPLVFFLASALSGAALIWLREWAFKKGNPDASLTEIAKTAEDGKTARAVALGLRKMFHAFTYSGAFGLLGDWSENVLAFSDRLRGKNPLQPPGISAFLNFYSNIVMKLAQQERLTLADLHDWIKAEFPGYDYTRAAVVGAGGAITQAIGDEWRESELQSARLAETQIRRLAIRYADEAGFERPGPRTGDRNYTPRSPEYRELHAALLVGDLETVKAVRDKMMQAAGAGWDDQKRELSRLRGAVAIAAPDRLGGLTPNDAREYRQDFKSWLKQREPGMVPALEKLQADYKNTAHAAGLMGDPREAELRDQVRTIKEGRTLAAHQDAARVEAAVRSGLKQDEAERALATVKTTRMLQGASDTIEQWKSRALKGELDKAGMGLLLKTKEGRVEAASIYGDPALTAAQKVSQVRAIARQRLVDYLDNLDARQPITLAEIMKAAGK